MADATERTQYFDGQFLRAADFIDEQSYHLDRRRRLNRLLHTGGVAEGLTVGGSLGQTTVTVSPGTAVDRQGREIVLAEQREVPLPTGQASVDVFISYQEQPVRPSLDPGITGFTRMLESPNLAVVLTGTIPADAVLLARVPLTAANGQVAGPIANTVRTVIGAVLADRSVTEPKLADNAVSTRTIVNGAVSGPKLANNAVSTNQIQNGAITSDKLASNAVGSPNIADGAVTEPKLGNGTVSTRTVQANAIGAAQLRADATNDVNRAVGTDHIRDGTITRDKLADNAVGGTKLQSHPTDSTQRAVSAQHVQTNAVSIAQLQATLIFDADVSVPAAPAAGQIAEQVVILETADRHGFYLISTRYVAPRPPTPSPIPINSSFTWTQRNSLFKPPVPIPVAHRQELVIQNPNTFAITVSCRVYRLAE